MSPPRNRYHGSERGTPRQVEGASRRKISGYPITLVTHSLFGASHIRFWEELTGKITILSIYGIKRGLGLDMRVYIDTKIYVFANCKSVLV